MTIIEIVYGRVADEESAYALARRLNAPALGWLELDVRGPILRAGPTRVWVHDGDHADSFTLDEARLRFLPS